MKDFFMRRILNVGLSIKEELGIQIHIEENVRQAVLNMEEKNCRCILINITSRFILFLFTNKKICLLTPCQILITSVFLM